MNNKMVPISNYTPPISTEKKKISFSAVFIIFLLIVILGLGGYIAIDKIFLEQKVTDCSTKVSTDESNINSISLLKIEDTINLFDLAFNDYNTNYFGYLFKQDSLSVKDFDDTAAILAAIYPYLEETNSTTYISNGTVKNNFDKMFGDYIAYSPKNVTFGDGYSLIYNNKYYGYTRVGNGVYFNPTYFTYTNSVTIKDTKVEVNRYVAYLKYSEDHTSVNVYKDANSSYSVGTLSVKEGSYSEDELISKFKSKLNAYVYTFTKVNDNYYFTSIKKAK